MSKKQVLFINGWAVPKLVQYAVADNKLWSDDSGRDMAGNNKGTLIGIFPKIQVKVGSFSEDEMSQFLSIVDDNPELTVKWWDPRSKTLRNGDSYYINDFEVTLINTRTMKYKGFDFNLIPNRKKV